MYVCAFVGLCATSCVKPTLFSATNLLTNWAAADFVQWCCACVVFVVFFMLLTDATIYVVCNHKQHTRTQSKQANVNTNKTLVVSGGKKEKQQQKSRKGWSPHLKTQNKAHQNERICRHSKYVCISIHTYVCMCVCTYVCIFLCMYAKKLAGVCMCLQALWRLVFEYLSVVP